MKHRVLFVDDDPNITSAFSRIFHEDTIEVLTAQSGAEALSILEGGETAVVVSDERMPGLSGSEFLAEVRARFPDTVRIMLTGYATLELVLDVINRAEVYRFLMKPCSFVELGKVVRGAVEKREALRGTHRLLTTVRAQATLLDRIEEKSPEILQTLIDHERPEPHDLSLSDKDLVDRIQYEVKKFEDRQRRIRGEVEPA